MSFDLAWAAGFFDGEGCIQLVTRTRGRCTEVRLQVTVVNTDSRSLRRFKDLFGGNIQVCHRAENPRGYKPSWTWFGVHQIGENALRAMLPWLLVKREQADIALQARAIKKRGVRGRPDQAALADLLWLKGQLQGLRATEPAAQSNPSVDTER